MTTLRFDATVVLHYLVAMPIAARSRSLPAGAFAALGLAALALSPALAQTKEQAPPKPPLTEAAPPATEPEAQRLKSSLDKAPATAAEKARLLADLYAHLATAEDEEQGKKYAERIERVWAISGSDTVALLMARATKAVEEKKHELALKLYDTAVELAPDYAEGFNRRAYFHFTQNNFQAAVGDLRRALALDPNHFRALEGLAQIWRETGDKRGALRVMKQLMDVHPHAPGAKTIYEELKRDVDGQGI